jgi:plasmid replication initiation protein
MKNDQSGLIVHSRDIANSTWGMNEGALRILNLALSKVDSRRENPGIVSINTDDYLLAYDVNKRHVNKVLRDSIERLVHSSIKLDFEGVPDELKYKEINWLSEGAFDNGVVSLIFSKSVEPYLFDIKERFVKLKFDEIKKLPSSFAFRLLQNLVQHETSPNHKSGDMWRVELTLEQIYKMSPHTVEYASWFQVNSRLVDPALEKINSTQPFCITCEPVKIGRKINSVIFHCFAEREIIEKPVRPRLKKRPKVIEGSHEHGLWARENMNILVTYFEKVRAYFDGDTSSVKVEDLKKIVAYAKILGEQPNYYAFHALSDRARKI